MFLAGKDASNSNSTTLDLTKNAISRSSTTTSSEYALLEALEVMRDEPEEVFVDPNGTLTSHSLPPAKKMPRMSSCDDIFLDTPPVAQEGILTKFFGYYEPGVSTPETVRLQILDIIECTLDGFISKTIIC